MNRIALLPILPFLLLPFSNRLEAQTAKVLLVNEQPTSVASTRITLPAEQVYKTLELSPGSPVQISSENGRMLPGSLSADGNTLNIWAGMESLKAMEAEIKAAEEWQASTLPIVAHENPEKLTAMVSNGLLTAVFQDEVFSIYLGSAAKVTDLSDEDRIFESFSLHRSLHADASDIHEYQAEKSPEGWTRVFRSDAPAVEVKASIEDGGARILVTHRFIHEEARAIHYKEILTLLPGEPIIDYRSVFINEGTETCYLGSRANEFSAYITGKYDNNMQVVRGNGQLVNEGRLGWFSPRWFSAVTKNGYSLCFTALQPNIPGSHYFDFHRANISTSDSRRIVKFGQAGLHNGAADAEKWAIFHPGIREEIGVGVHVFLPGQAARSIMKSNWENAASGKAMSIPSPLSVYLDGEPVHGGSITSIHDAFSQPERWIKKGLTLWNGHGQTTLQVSRKEGSAYRALCSDMNEPFLIRSYVEALSPGATLSITAREIGSQKEYQLAEVREPGIIEIDLKEKSSWEDLRSFILGFQLKGKRKGEATLTTTSIGEPPPDSPELLSPLDGVSLTDISAYYTWKEVKGCGEYELDISTTPGFKNPMRQLVILTNPKPYFYPRELLPPGTYYWRVRALQYDRNGTPGAWSEVRHFDLNDNHTAQAPIFEISAGSPLITMRGDNWRSRNVIQEALDQDIKPYFSFRTYPTEGDFYKNLEAYGEADMKVFYEAIKPYGPSGKSSSLADIEYAYQHYPNVIGSCLGEEFYWYWDDEIAREYLERHHILAAKYGRVFHWSDLHKLGWNELAKRPEYASGIMASVILPLLKTTEPYTAYITQGHLAGWYLAGLADNTGTQADIWYWASVGFRKCGENNFGVRQGYHRLIPPVTYIQHWLLGMMQGGAVFSNEWGNIAGQNGPNELWTRYYAPFFKGIIEHGMIPTREEYTKATKVIVHGKLPADFPQVERWGFTEPDYGPFEVLYRELYGAKDPLTDFIPKKGRYGLVAVLPESVTDFQQEGIQVVSLFDLQTPEQIHATFDPLYPQNYKGDALVLQVGKSLVIMNSNENLDVDQSYEIPFEGEGLIQSMKGDICVHKYIMGKHEDKGRRFWFQANVSIVSPEKSTFPEKGRVQEGTYETRDTEIIFKCSVKPCLSWQPEEAGVKSNWDPESGHLNVILPHDTGAVSISLEKAKK